MELAAAIQHLAQRFSRLDVDQRRAVYQKIRAEGLSMVRFPVLPREASLGECCPASYSQRRLWFLWQLDRDSTAYHISGALKLEGTLDVEALRSSFSALVARHESLRTVFIGDEQGMAQQRILAEGRLDIPLLDLGTLNEAERDTQAQAAAHRLHATPFELTRGPLLRVGLIRLSAQQHLLIVVMHHIISDGWSMQVLVDEFVAHYRTAVQGQAVDLAPLPIQYADYAQWQLQWLEAGEQARQLDYWKAQLGTDHPVLQLPADHPRRADGRYRAARHGLSLPASLAQGLRERARGASTTLFVTLLAGLQALLHRYTGQEDIRIGVPIANRQRVETEGVIGFFVNTQVLRNRIRGRDTLESLLAQARESALGAQSHQDLPFEQLVEALHPERSLGTTPLFQVVLNHLRNDDGALQSLPGLTLSGYELGHQAAQFELTVEVVEQADGRVELGLIYAEELFEAATMERLARHYLAVLEALAERPHAWVSELALLAGRELACLLDWSRGQAVGGEVLPVHRQFELQAGANPDAVAVIFGEESLSYGELNRRANRLAHHLIALGVKPESRVGIVMQRSIDLVVAIIAVLKAGGAYVPLDPESPPGRLVGLAGDARLALFLTDRRSAPTVAAAAGGTVPVIVDALVLEDSPGGAPDLALANENLAYVIYTSGSTGKPKGVMVSHGPLATHCRATALLYEMGPWTTELHFLNFSFDGAQERLFAALGCGAALVLRDSELWTPEQTLAVMARCGVTNAGFPPAYLQELARGGAEAGKVPPVKLYSFGGEAMPREGVELVCRHLRPQTLINGYGPTEAVVTPLLWKADGAVDFPSAYAPIGKPVAGRKALVLDADMALVPAGIAGELYLGGRELARGYLDRPGLSAERFVADPFDAAGGRLYRTGDLVRWNAEGEMEYLGRLDHQVKIRGFRIELGEIEAQLLAQPEIREAVVVVDEGPGGPRLVAYVSLQPGREVDGPVLRERLGRLLPEHMLPAAVMGLARLPLNPNGKIDRKALPRPEFGHAAGYEAPRGKVEEALATIWSELLPAAQPGRHDDFFELGGHSLLALRLLRQIQEDLGASELSLSQLFTHRRLADQASLCRTTATVETGALVMAEGGEGVPLFCFPGLIANSAEYRPLAEALAGERTIQAFVSHALGAGRWNACSVERLAAGFAAHIRRCVHGGSCALLGWSLGGDLAFETARQLEGELDVVFLGMVDVSRSALPSPPVLGQDQRRQALERMDEWFGRSRMGSHWRSLLAGLPPQLRDAVIAEVLDEPAGPPLDGPDYDSKEYLHWAMLDARRMLYGYDHGRLEIGMDVWLAEDAWARPGVVPRDWRDHGPVRALHVIRGADHMSVIRAPEFLAQLRLRLQEADRSRAGAIR